MKETLVTQIEAGQAEDGYRYKHFTVPLLLRDMRYSGAALKPGQKIPNSTIFGLEGNQTSVNELGTNKPILLVTGSLTCPMTASSMPTLMRLFREFGAEVDFVTLNVREAHPGENVRSRVRRRRKSNTREDCESFTTYPGPWSSMT